MNRPFMTSIASQTNVAKILPSLGKDVADFRMQLEAKDVRADTQGQIIS
jgi:hypothetical protein